MKAIHKASDIIRLSLRNLVMHSVRSLLTMLSILFGVWSVIAMLAINEGASAESERRLRELGSNNIIIETVKPPKDSSKASGTDRGALIYGLTYLDYRRISDNVADVARSVVSHRTKKVARVGYQVMDVMVIGTEPVYAEIARIDMTSGRFITPIDRLKKQPYCVLTEALAKRLFRGRDPLGHEVKLGPTGEPFKVVGVLRHLPAAMAGTGVDPDSCVIIPLSTDQSRHGMLMVERSQGSRTTERVEIHQIILQMKDEEAVIAGANTVRSILNRYHDGNDYKLEVPLELLRQQAAQQRLWNIMFISIALVSLLVGGIGIANIMLASVTERTREIGVRRAMGAKRRDITVQFLVEAVTLTTIGGALGIGIGLLLPWVIHKFMELPTKVTTFTIILPFVVSVAVGLISGLWPALRAARLDPIVALRHE